MSVAVLITSIPERAHLLKECMASVRSQTLPPDEVHVNVDDDHLGCAVSANKLVKLAKSEWIVPFADDDLLLPGCLETLMPVARRNPDAVVYAPPLVWGQPQEWFTQAPPCIPSFCVMPRAMWWELGGYDEGCSREEDRKMWIRAMAAGVEFIRVDHTPTWVYRHHGGNKSFNNGVSS